MRQRFDFDPQLPALPLAFDFDAVAQLFAEHWPKAADGAHQVTITKCRLQDTKYQPLKRCVTTYTLQVEQSGAPPRQTIGVISITPAGVEHRLYDDDPRLPWLGPATEPGGMIERFAGLLEDSTIESCVVTPVRYKPAARCVFRYDLVNREGQQVFFGKLLADGADQLMATIAALHRASQNRPEMPRILPPMAYWPDIHMLIQPGVVGGAELNTLAFDPNEDSAKRERLMRDSGARLAGLHSCDAVDAPSRTIEDDLEELREYIAPIGIVDAALASRYEAAVAMVASTAAGRSEPARVASHGAFRTDQFMIENDELVMIDLDGFCWANPARDIGNLLAYLHWKAIRNQGDATFIQHAGRLFLDGYQATGAKVNGEWLALYQAASMLKIVGRRFRSLTVKEWPLVPQLLDAALSEQSNIKT